MNSKQQELDNFKSQIDLVMFSAKYGYDIDKKRSSRSSISVKHNTNGDRILIGKGQKGFYIYSSVHNSQDQGTIIDFCQQREAGLSLGGVRKLLRPYLHGNATLSKPQDYKQNLEAIEVDLAYVKEHYLAATPITQENRYLTHERCIPAEIYLDPKFAGRVRIDQELGNILFPHWEAKGVLTGFEIKNDNFTGFAKHGAKRFFASGFKNEDTELIIAETAIDALSYAALFKTANKRFLSTAGALNPQQPSLIHSAIQKLPAGGCVIAATDYDKGGDILADELETIFKSVARSDITFKRHRPELAGNDWNDFLKAEFPRI